MFFFLSCTKDVWNFTFNFFPPTFCVKSFIFLRLAFDALKMLLFVFIMKEHFFFFFIHWQNIKCYFQKLLIKCWYWFTITVIFPKDVNVNKEIFLISFKICLFFKLKVGPFYHVMKKYFCPCKLNSFIFFEFIQITAKFTYL